MIEEKWSRLCKHISEQFDVDSPQVESILFLIGLQELQKFDIKFSKSMKLDVMHVALCTLLSHEGYYKITHVDDDGWPHFENLKPLPPYNVGEQTLLLKNLILSYFSKIFNFI